MLNNKGFTIAEVLVSFTMITFILLSIIGATVFYRDKLKEEEIKSQLVDFKNSITKIIYDDIISEKVKRVETCLGISNCLNLIGKDNSVHTLRIIEVFESTGEDKRGTYLSYDGIKYFLPESDLSEEDDYGNTIRAYYFTYDIPEEITYTDINTELFIPNTGVLLFRGFYYKYVDYLYEVDELSKPIPHKQKLEYYDKNPEIQKLIDESKGALKDAKKLKTGKYIPLYIFYKTLLYTILGAIVGALCVIGYIILLVIGSVFVGKLRPNETTAIIIAVVGCLITVIVMWVINVKDGFIKTTKTKEKEETIQMALDTIAEGEGMIQKNIANKEADIKQIEEDNLKIDEENKKIDEENSKRVVKLKELLDEFSAFKEKYPKYMVIENYDDVDKSLVDVAIEDGAITFDSVEFYRKAAREKIDADEKFKQEMAMRQKEVQAQQAQTQVIKASTLQSSIDAELMRQEVQRQTQAQNQAIYAQMAQADKLYKQKEYYGRQVTARLDELRYENYLNSKYL